MLRTLILQQQVRIVSAGATFGIGFTITRLFQIEKNMFVAIAICSIGMAIIIGTGKLASP